MSEDTVPHQDTNQEPWEAMMAAQLKQDQWLSVRRLGGVLAALALLITVTGHVAQNEAFGLRSLFLDLWANLGTELASIAVTVLIIDGLNQRREVRAQKSRLTRQMNSRARTIASQAVEELRVYGWLADGSLQKAALGEANLEKVDLLAANLEGAYLGWAKLQGAILRRANLQGANLAGAKLQGADLEEANLRGASLVRANLKGARLRAANLEGARLTGANLEEVATRRSQLAQASTLRGATMPNGSRYDGRFNLEGDIEQARLLGINPDHALEMAEFWYGVPVENYEHGQARAREYTHKQLAEK